MKKTVIFVAALAAIPSVAHADALPTISVQISDLDLTTVADQQRFDDRVVDAARRVCRSETRDLGAASLEQACRNSLRKAAWDAVALPIID